jgi:hypothetical protein
MRVGGAEQQKMQATFQAKKKPGVASRNSFPHPFHSTKGLQNCTAISKSKLGSKLGPISFDLSATKK